MCGLVGMAGSLDHKCKKVMQELFYLNTLRGQDSTGLTAVRRDRSVCTRKMTVPGYEFIQHPLVDRAMCYDDQLWLGHGRFKTLGEVNRANAHPFEVLDNDGDVLLVGAHNGTLTNRMEIERLVGERYSTDSEALINWLLVAHDYKEAISKLRGAWSLVWWDPLKDSIHLCRNDERPMVYAFSKDRKVFLWASEAWMLVNACRRNGVELEQNDRGMSCYSTAENTLYTLEIPQAQGTPFLELKREGGYTGAAGTTFQTGFQTGQKKWNHWWNADQEAKKKASSGEKETTSTSSTNGPSTLGTPPDKVKGFEGKLVPLSVLKEVKKKGCGWCGDLIKDGHIFSWLDEDLLCCVHCMRDTHPKENPHAWEDDDIPFYLRGDDEEYRTLIAAAATGKPTTH